MKFLFLILILALSPSISFTQTLREKGIELFRLNNYAQAIVVLEEFLTEGVTDQQAATYLGASYVKLGNTKKAVEVFRSIPIIKPGSEDLIYDKKIRFRKIPPAKHGSDVILTEGSGKARLAVEFRHDGQIGFAFPFSVSSDKLIPGATRAAQSIKFEPAVSNGKPVTVVLIVDYDFSH